MNPRAILFDLDGTLLPLEFNEFIPYYFQMLNEKFRHIFPHGNLPDLVAASTEKMVHNDGTRSNSDAFWEDFASRTGLSRTSLEPVFDDFYRHDFNALRRNTRTWPNAAATVNAVRMAGLGIVLATNPVFPRLAIEHRLSWAGLDVASFDFITDYENMRYAKPNPGYYTQITEEMAVAPGECLMVGNDVGLDLAPARAAGMVTFMVNNEYSVGRDGFEPDYSGPLADVLQAIS